MKPSGARATWTPLALLLVGSAAALLFCVACYTRADPDLWGHVRTGLDTLRTHHLSDRDPYSFTGDRPVIYHEWLSEWMMAALYAAAGSAGLAVLKGTLAVAFLGIVWGALVKASLGARLTAVAVAAVGAASLLQTLRPQVWSVVCLAVLCRALVAESQSSRWWLPLLFAVWANLHGGWIVGIGVLGAWALGDSITRPNQSARWVFLVVLCVGSTLATPYGVRLWQFIATTVGLERPQIEDWQPLWRLAPSQWLPWIVGVAVAVWAVARRPRYLAPMAASLLVLAYASLRVARTAPLFSETAVLFAAPLIASRWPAAGAVSLRIAPQDRPIVGLMSAVALAGALWMGRMSLTCIRIDDRPEMPDRAAMERLKAATSGRLVTFFNWGEYALWHLGPRVRVSMDGRREAVYSDARLAEHDAILQGTPAGLATLRDWRAEYVWLPASSLSTKEWLAANGYRIEYDTGRSFIAVRNDLPRLPDQGGVVPSPCFPG